MKTEAEIADELYEKELDCCLKIGSIRVVNRRKEARGRECQVRIPGVCNGNPETVVGAHYRVAGLSGFGIKSDDLFIAWACSDCHDAIDRRRHTDLEREWVRLLHAEGVFRTQEILHREGKL